MERRRREGSYLRDQNQTQTNCWREAQEIRKEAQVPSLIRSSSFALARRAREALPAGT